MLQISHLPSPPASCEHVTVKVEKASTSLGCVDKYNREGEIEKWVKAERWEDGRREGTQCHGFTRTRVSPRLAGALRL